ncbi:hypothetical protein ACVW1C_007761 [Bradyrhizobium sp. USDA 4011]
MHDRSPSTTELTDTERLNRLRLIRSDNVGPRTFASLLRHFGDAAHALERLPDLARRGGASGPGRIASEADAAAELAACAKFGSISSHRRKRTIRRGLPPSTTRRRCSACAAHATR